MSTLEEQLMRLVAAQVGRDMEAQLLVPYSAAALLACVCTVASPEHAARLRLGEQATLVIASEGQVCSTDDWPNEGVPFHPSTTVELYLPHPDGTPDHVCTMELEGHDQFTIAEVARTMGWVVGSRLCEP